jgi:hypothetical protein
MLWRKNCCPGQIPSHFTSGATAFALTIPKTALTTDIFDA